jgi:hypothetical protein
MRPLRIAEELVMEVAALVVTLGAPTALYVNPEGPIQLDSLPAPSFARTQI